MKTKKINEVRKQIEYEYKRNSYPDGFPKIPDISGKRYTDQEFFDLEFENIFLKSWLMIFREDEIPNPGDFKIFDKLQRDILIVRQKDKSIKAFYNTCSHRGASLVVWGVKDGRDVAGHIHNYIKNNIEDNKRAVNG